MGTVYIGKCRTKGCTHARRLVASDFGESTTGAAVWVRRTGIGFARCPDHGLYKVKPVHGHHSPDVPCTEKCVSATGPSCDCSCGGANHGAAHA